ncbi:MAG: YcxB family protein [Acidovorax sp.]|nr:MAG: YcxB family protein [Acidovorax sp.]
MQLFTLTRSDFRELQARALASTRAYAKRGSHEEPFHNPAQETSSIGKRVLTKSLIWLALGVCFFVLFRMWGSVSSEPGYLLCALASGLITLALTAWAFAAYTGRLYNAMVADDGWFLSPQSIDADEGGIDQVFKGGSMHLDWSAFTHREETDTKFFLFIEPGHCLPVPKAALSMPAQELILQRIPLRG